MIHIVYLICLILAMWMKTELFYNESGDSRPYIRFLPERDYVTFGSLLSQIHLSVACRLLLCIKLQKSHSEFQAVKTEVEHAIFAIAAMFV